MAAPAGNTTTTQPTIGMQCPDLQAKLHRRFTSMIHAMQEAMRPLAKAATMLPPTAFRFDPGAAITVLARYLPQIVMGGTDGLKLLGSFKKARKAAVPALRHLALYVLHSAAADRSLHVMIPA
jgi:hypothetical protein